MNTIHFVLNLTNHVYRAMSWSGNAAQLVLNMGLKGHYYFSVLERLSQNVNTAVYTKPERSLLLF